MSGRQLAEAADVSPSFISDLEKNKSNPTINTIDRICSALGITLADFFAPAGAGQDPLPPDLRRLLESARNLDPDELTTVQHLLDILNRHKS